MAGSLDLVQFDRKVWNANCSPEGVADYFTAVNHGTNLGSLHRPYDAISLVTEAFGKSFQLDVCELSEEAWITVLEKAHQMDTEAPERLEAFIKKLSDILENFDFQQNVLTFYFCH